MKLIGDKVSCSAPVLPKLSKLLLVFSQPSFPLQYLQDTLGDFVKTVLETGDECEVDPTRVQNNSLLQRNQTNLIMYCEMAWFKIINSHCFFPMSV